MSEHPDWEGYKDLLLDWYRTGTTSPYFDGAHGYWDALLTGDYLIYTKLSAESQQIRSAIGSVIDALGTTVVGEVSLTSDDVNRITSAIATNTRYQLTTLLSDIGDIITATPTNIETKISETETVIMTALENLDTDLYTDILLNRTKLDEIINSLIYDTDYTLSDIYDHITGITDTLSETMQSNVDVVSALVTDKLEDFSVLLGGDIANVMLEVISVGQILSDKISDKAFETMFIVEAAKGFIVTKMEDMAFDLDTTLTSEVWLLETNLVNQLNLMETNIKDKIDNVMALDNISKIMTAILHVDEYAKKR